MSGYLEALEVHREELDSLNVYPVPDGDTGTNLVFTQRAVVDALFGLPNAAEPGADLRSLARTIANASLMAARGNSGVILAQALHGLCEVLAQRPAGGGAVVADALANASAEADHAVASPQEGTALTVLRDAARAARTAAATDASGGPARDPSEADVADAALVAARRSLAETRETLPALWREGVVDAGGLGFVLLLDALRAVLRGVDRTVGVGPLGPLGGRPGAEPARSEFGSEVQFVLSGLPEQVERLVGRLGRMGVSLSVADGDGLHAFHIHTNEPARVLEAARAAGTLIGESVVPLGVPVIAGLVAVSAGPGVIAALGALGAVVVDGGGEPTHRDLARAIRRAPGSGGVVVLVDRAASLAAAERAVADGRRATRIVAAGSVPAALAAATTYDPALDLDTNVALMRAAAAACAAGEVTGAPSTSPPGGVGSRPWVGTRDGSTVSVATDPATAALDLVQELLDGTTSAGAITIVLGDGAAPATDPVVAALRRAHPDLELHPVAGGQARSRYLIGVG